MKKAKKATPKKRVVPGSRTDLQAQIDRLASVILYEVKVKPEQGESRIDTAIRLLRAQANPETVAVALTPREARQSVLALLRLAESINPKSHTENSAVEFINALAKKIDRALMGVEGKGQNLMGVELAK